MTAPAPPPPSPLATPAAWNLVAAAYAGDVVARFTPYAQRALALAEVPPRGDIVDVACGPGTLAIEAALTANRVAAIDFSADMIAQLRDHVAYAKLGNIDATVGDGQALPYGDAEFDAGFSMFGLIFFPERARGWAELRRVVRPGGRVVVSSWVPFTRVPVMETMMSALKAAMPGLPFGQGAAPLGEPDACRAEAGAAGFVSVEVHEVTYTSDYGSTDELWDRFERTLAPLVLLRQKLGADAWRPIAAQLHATLGATFGEGPHRLAMPALLTVATV